MLAGAGYRFSADSVPPPCVSDVHVPVFRHLRKRASHPLSFPIHDQCVGLPAAHDALHEERWSEHVAALAAPAKKKIAATSVRIILWIMDDPPNIYKRRVLLCRNHPDRCGLIFIAPGYACPFEAACLQTRFVACRRSLLLADLHAVRPGCREFHAAARKLDTLAVAKSLLSS